MARLSILGVCFCFSAPFQSFKKIFNIILCQSLLKLRVRFRCGGWGGLVNHFHFIILRKESRDCKLWSLLCPVTSFKYDASQSTCPWVIWHLNACGSSHKFLFSIWWSRDEPRKWPLSSLCFVQLRRFIKNGLHWKTNWNNFVQSLCCDPQDSSNSGWPFLPRSFLWMFQRNYLS